MNARQAILVNVRCGAAFQPPATARAADQQDLGAGDKIELNLGADPEVVFELVKLRSRRDDIWIQLHGVDVFRQVGSNELTVETNASVVGWDDRSVFTQRIRNYTDKKINVEIRRSYDGHILFRSKLEPKLHDYRTVELTASVDPGEKESLRFEVVQRQGRNAKQHNVTLEEGNVAKK